MLVVALKIEICKQHLSLHSEFFNAKTLVPSKVLYLIPFGARRSMSIVPETSSWLARIHHDVLMTSEEFVLRSKVWRQNVAHSARANETGNSMPEQISAGESWPLPV